MEIYKDFYGCTACVRAAKSGAARLTIRLPNGKLMKTGNYTSRTGALRAMRRLSDSWAKR